MSLSLRTVVVKVSGISRPAAARRVHAVVRTLPDMLRTRSQNCSKTSRPQWVNSQAFIYI